MEVWPGWLGVAGGDWGWLGVGWGGGRGREHTQNLQLSFLNALCNSVMLVDLCDEIVIRN